MDYKSPRIHILIVHSHILFHLPHNSLLGKELLPFPVQDEEAVTEKEQGFCLLKTVLARFLGEPNIISSES